MKTIPEENWPCGPITTNHNSALGAAFFPYAFF